MKYDPKFITKEIESGQTVFNADKAIKGQTLAALKTVEGEETMYSVENFKLVTSDKYSATVDGVTHYYDINGNCVDGSGAGNLIFVKGDIEKNTDNVADADDPDSEEEAPKATISSLNPRDYFAQEVMNGFMKNVDKPFSMSDADIYKYSTLSYKIAQSMINVAAYNRKADPESSEIEVDAKTLNGNTEKLLNNISVSLNTMAEASEGGGGGGESTFDGNLTGWPSSNLSILLGTGPGTSELNPIYTSGSWPTRSALIPILAGDVDSFLVFKGAAPAYFTFSNLKGAISNYLEDNTSSGGLTSLTSAILGKLTPADIFNKMENDTANVHLIKALIDSRIKQFAADLKTANPSLNITIPSNWTT